MASARPYVSKETFLNALTCPAMGWYTRHEDCGAPTVADQFRMQEGLEVHQRARRLHPHGVLIADPDIARAAANTARLMTDASVTTIFEATFAIDGYVAKADIVHRLDVGWHLIEVKSNVNEDNELLDDLAYTTMVMHRCGVVVTKTTLQLVSKDYRLGMDDQRLFVELDRTAEATARAAESATRWQAAADAITADDRPDAVLIHDCRNCSYFETECIGVGVTNHIFDLPRLSAKKFGELTDLGVKRIDQIPVDYKLTDQQERVREAVVTGASVVNAKLGSELNEVRWPAYYFDFETVKTVVPLYENVAPHEQIPTQYSLHTCSAPGTIDDHREYLADPATDCRRELAERLLSDLKGDGSIIVYSSFEKRILNSLAELYPDLADDLKRCIDRLYDLEATLRRNLCHPLFRGKTSIKVVLPILVPDLSYEGLSIGHGDTAVAMFAKMARGEISTDRVEAIRRDLQNYCELDTLAMVRLHERLLDFVAA